MENEFEKSTRRGLAGLHDRHDVLLAHDHELLAVHLDVGAGVFTEENFVASFNVRGAHFAVLQDFALADGDDLSEGRFLGRGVGDHDAARGLTLFGFALDDESVVQWSNIHGTSFWLVAVSRAGNFANAACGWICETAPQIHPPFTSATCPPFYLH